MTDVFSIKIVIIPKTDVENTYSVQELDLI